MKIAKMLEKANKKHQLKSEIRMNKAITRWLAKNYVDCKYSAIAEEHAKCSDIAEAIAAMNMKRGLAELELELV